MLLKGDVFPGTADSCYVYHQFWAYGSRLVCPMRDPVNSYELWMSDGTAAGTVLVKDINPGNFNASPQDFVELNGILYFVAYEPTHGQELWRSDGTTAGTFLFKDIQPGTGQGVPFSLQRLGNQIVFFADEGYATGWELWRTDGTVAGTVMVKDINPGHGDSHTFDLDMFCAPPGAQIAVFTASDGVRGDELWRTDGTAAGTVQHADLNPGNYSSQPDRPFLAGSYLFFTADNGTGRELYVMTSMACAIPYGKGCPGTGGVVPQLGAQGTPFLGNASFANVVSRGLPNSTAILFYGIAPSELQLGNGCTLWFDILQPYFVFVAGTNAAGTAVFPLPVPNDRSLVGGQAFTMADVVDPNGAYANIVSMTGGVKHVFNTR
jgi:ELWxxDGT repeat protein